MGTHLDHITRQLVGPPGQLGELTVVFDDATVGRHPRSEHERRVHEVLLFADGTHDVGVLSEVDGDAQQLRMGVTDVEAREPAAAVLVDHVPAGQAVVDGARATGACTAYGIGSELHGDKGYRGTGPSHARSPDRNVATHHSRPRA